MTTEQFLICLAKTESNDTNLVDIHGKTYVLMGDDGRALGRWQVHPDYVETYAKRFGCPVKLNERWDDWIERIITAFASYYMGMMPPVEVAMYFHMGHRVRTTDADWDKLYADRFNACAKEFAA